MSQTPMNLQFLLGQLGSRMTGAVNDVRDFGAVLDGSTDDTAAIQAAFDAVSSNRRAVYIPGTAVISETLTIPLVTGFRVFGSGVYNHINPNQTLRGGGSALIWAGDDGGTMVRCRASQGIWSNISLFGSPWGSEADGAGIKFLLGKDVGETGIGTGKWTFENWFDEGPGIGIQAGTETAAGNSDVVSFTGNTYFRGSETGLKVVNTQGMGFCFQQVFGNCPVVFDFVEGGGLDVQSVICTNSETTHLLRLHSPGINNGHYRIGTVKRDAQVLGMKVVEMQSGAVAHVHIGHLHLGASGGSTYSDLLFDLHGGISLTLCGSNRLNPDAFKATNAASKTVNVQLERCVLDDYTSDLFDATSTGAYQARVVSCLNPDFSPVTDYTESNS